MSTDSSLVTPDLILMGSDPSRIVEDVTQLQLAPK